MDGISAADYENKKKIDDFYKLNIIFYVFLFLFFLIHRMKTSSRFSHIFFDSIRFFGALRRFCFYYYYTYFALLQLLLF